MTIANSTLEDIDEIFRLYKIASDYQKSKKTVVVWPDFDRNMVTNEITENRQFKLLIDGQVACVWAITFTDAQIWQERNAEPAIYIHRIATNANFRGQNFVGKIIAWARTYALAQQKRFIRLDTIGNNTSLIRHYTQAGFNFLGIFKLNNVDTLPPHYKEGPCCLFEIDTQKL